MLKINLCITGINYILEIMKFTKYTIERTYYAIFLEFVLESTRIVLMLES